MPFNPEKNYDLYEILCKAEAGDRDAMLEAVNLMAVEGYAEEDEDGDIRKKYVRYLTILADQGCSDPDSRTEARIMLGEVYARGKFVPRDAERALQLYELAAKDGALVAWECIGDMYYLGSGVPQNYKKAHAYYMKAGRSIKNGSHSLSTWYRLGEMYRQGLGVKQNPDKALECYSKALDDEPDGFPDDFDMPCLLRYCQLALQGVTEIDDKDSMKDIWNTLENIRDYYKAHTAELAETNMSFEELDQLIEDAKKQWEELPEKGIAYNFDVTTPMSLDDFNEKIRDTIWNLESKYEEFLVAGIENTREDKISAVQTYVRSDFSYHVEIIRMLNLAKKEWLCFTTQKPLTMEETINLFKSVLVDCKTPDLSQWKDITYEAHHGRT